MTQTKVLDSPDDFAWIREVRDKMYEETKHMTHEEFNMYTRQGVAEFGRGIRRVREQGQESSDNVHKK